MSIVLDRSIISDPENWGPILPRWGRASGWRCAYFIDPEGDPDKKGFHCILRHSAEAQYRTVEFLASENSSIRNAVYDTMTDAILPHVTGKKLGEAWHLTFPYSGPSHKVDLVREINKELEKIDYTFQ